jgi:hypothetical protein
MGATSVLQARERFRRAANALIRWSGRADRCRHRRVRLPPRYVARQCCTPNGPYRPNTPKDQWDRRMDPSSGQSEQPIPQAAVEASVRSRQHKACRRRASALKAAPSAPTRDLRHGGCDIPVRDCGSGPVSDFRPWPHHPCRNYAREQVSDHAELASACSKPRC